VPLTRPHARLATGVLAMLSPGGTCTHWVSICAFEFRSSLPPSQRPGLRLAQRRLKSRATIAKPRLREADSRDATAAAAGFTASGPSDLWPHTPVFGATIDHQIAPWAAQRRFLTGRRPFDRSLAKARLGCCCPRLQSPGSLARSTSESRGVEPPLSQPLRGSKTSSYVVTLPVPFRQDGLQLVDFKPKISLGMRPMSLN
jgi:hypothetical protein